MSQPLQEPGHSGSKWWWLGVCYGWYALYRRILVYIFCLNSISLKLINEIFEYWKSITIFFLFVTSFSGHRPAQRECARTRLRSNARWQPHPIPQPVKVDDTTGVYAPYSVSNSSEGSFTSHKTKSVKVLRDGTHSFFPPYPRRLKGLTICRCHFKGSTFFSVV